jgi:hypothetical protein
MQIVFLKGLGFQQQQQDSNRDGIIDGASPKCPDLNKDGIVDEPFQTMFDNTHILEESYKTFVKNGKLTKKEIETLEKLGAILEEADIKIDRQTGDATITQSNGNRIVLTFATKGIS